MMEQKQSSAQSPQVLRQQNKQPWRKPAVTYVPLHVTAASAASVDDGDGLGLLQPG